MPKVVAFVAGFLAYAGCTSSMDPTRPDLRGQPGLTADLLADAGVDAPPCCTGDDASMGHDAGPNPDAGSAASCADGADQCAACAAGSACSPGSTAAWNGLECECVGDSECAPGGTCSACGTPPCAWESQGAVCTCIPMPASCDGNVACASCLDDGECANGPDPVWNGSACVCE
jgi:hypothetical protein